MLDKQLVLVLRLPRAVSEVSAFVESDIDEISEFKAEQLGYGANTGKQLPLELSFILALLRLVPKYTVLLLNSLDFCEQCGNLLC